MYSPEDPIEDARRLLYSVRKPRVDVRTAIRLGTPEAAEYRVHKTATAAGALSNREIQVEPVNEE